ncbi:TrlF family AAA-like ATPase [Neobacillus drentensis]|uniref:TrlF family AAA-like ATPase n=1 Tax=Neobacillus drentensis TaxID=220684 RepID=UPI002FFE785F
MENRGSIWRKWDLHFHTPSSYDYKNKGVSNQDIINNLKLAGISAVAITDHHVMDIDRIAELQRLGQKEGIVVFPGIELRSEYGGSESVHFIGIFPETADLKTLWTKLQVPLKIVPKDVKKIGNDFVYSDFKESSKVIHELGGIITVHAGSKENGIESISNVQKFKQALKKDLAVGYIDIFEVGQEKDIKEYIEIVFPHLKKDFPIIISSDNHNIMDYKIKSDLWIKSDLSFSGLLQVIREPFERVKIGFKPEQIKNYGTKKTKYIDSIEICKSNSSLPDEFWADNKKINLNPGLISIIGNKGNGKSALADIIGLLGNSHHGTFEFLNKEKFKNPKSNKSNNFEATLKWASGEEITKKLSETIDIKKVERVKYLPQRFIESICNETNSNKNFDSELKKVIYSHVDNADKHGYSTLDELIEYKTKELQDTITIYRDKVTKINEKIVNHEKLISLDYKTNIQEKLKEKQNELETHNKIKPIIVEKPEEDSNISEESNQIDNEIKKLRKQKDQLSENKTLLENELLTRKNEVESAKKLITRIDNLSLLFDKFKNESIKDLEVINFKLEDILNVSINKNKLNEYLIETQKKIRDIQDQLIGDKGIEDQLQQINVKTIELDAKLDFPNKLYQEYLKNIEEWEEKRKLIIGTTDIIGSLEYYNKHLLEIENAIPEELLEMENQRIELVKLIFKHIQKITDVYKKLYEPVQNSIKEHKLVKENYELNFEASILIQNFNNQFFKLVAHTRGTFHGAVEGNQRLNDIILKYNFNSVEDVIGFIDEIISSLKIDQRNGSMVDLESLFKKETTTLDLYNLIFSLEYLAPIYELKLGNKDLEQLSPGEKGSLLLMFYLLVDKDDKPLIIDQPEENLDNQSVYELLVPCIKEAKLRRQIIIVTHNPNLATVCDSEQIIYSHMNKIENNKISYITGAIENDEINKKIVDILEGTWPAFDNRSSKYFVKSS